LPELFSACEFTSEIPIILPFLLIIDALEPPLLLAFRIGKEPFLRYPFGVKRKTVLVSDTILNKKDFKKVYWFLLCNISNNHL
jgi:hypothetical protein